VTFIKIRSRRREFSNSDSVEQNSYLHIKDAKLFFDVPRAKLSPRPFRPRQDNLKVVKGFRSHGVHNILCATENL
jgi:hypothetical protein